MYIVLPIWYFHSEVYCKGMKIWDAIFFALIPNIILNNTTNNYRDYYVSIQPPSHLQTSPTGIHIIDDPLIISQVYDELPVPLKPSRHCSSHVD